MSFIHTDMINLFPYQAENQDKDPGKCINRPPLAIVSSSKTLIFILFFVVLANCQNIVANILYYIKHYI